jgi:hypothetical protein
LGWNGPGALIHLTPATALHEYLEVGTLENELLFTVGKDWQRPYDRSLR